MWLMITYMKATSVNIKKTVSTN